MALLPDVEDFMNDIEVKLNAGHTESLMRKIGSNLNALLNRTNATWEEQTFTSNGNFVVPTGVTKVWLVGCGGGGAGAGSGALGFKNRSGGAGAPLGVTQIPVTPGATMPVIIGAGGVGGNGDGAVGGQTAITGAVFRGGKGGKMLTVDTGISPGSATGAQGAHWITPAQRIEAQDSALFEGGVSPVGGGGTGGAGPFGSGGVGAPASTGNGGNAGGGTGAGGGGAHDTSVFAPNFVGGNGGSGQLRISYLKP